MTARAAPKPSHDGPEALPADLGIRTPALALARERQHLVVKGARLQPDGGDAEALGLLQDPERRGGGRDDGDGRLPGAGQGREGLDGRDLGGPAAPGGQGGDGDGRGGRVDGRRGDVVVEVPGEDWVRGV